MLYQKYNKIKDENNQLFRARTLTAARADEEENWPLDAVNQKLSYSKMVYERNLRHFRKPKEEDNQSSVSKVTKSYTTYPVCGTSTGWFCCKRKF